MVDFPIDPARAALITVDMQNFFVEGWQTTPERLVLLERINLLSAICREASIPVVHVSHVLQPDASNAGILAEIFPTVLTVGFLNRGSDSAATHSGLVVESGDIRLEKPRYGAFHGTDLESILRSRGIDTVIIAGIATNVCCDTTAREAHARDFRVLFLSDGTHTSSVALHNATLETIGEVFGQVLTIEEVTRKIQTSAVVTPTM